MKTSEGKNWVIRAAVSHPVGDKNNFALCPKTYGLACLIESFL